jgi:hypothetical protein
MRLRLPVGSSLPVLSEVTGAREGTRLLLVVTTHARAEPCARLIAALHQSLAQASLLEQAFVLVLRDTSEHDYAAVLALLEARFSGRFALYESSRWLGKPGRFLAYQVAFDVARKLGAERALFFEDDVVVQADFVDVALRRFDEIDDASKAVLYLCRYDDDEPRGRWVRFRRRPLPGGVVARTQWFDLHAFVVNRSFFERLDWRLFPPYRLRWARHPTRSSGVSEQMTRRLFGRAGIYQVETTLAWHGREPSLLNVEARRSRRLDNFPEPPREPSCRDER